MGPFSKLDKWTSIFDGVFTEFFRDVGSGLGALGGAISPALPAIAGSLLSKEAYDRLSDIGTQSILGTTVGRPAYSRRFRVS